MLSVQTTQLHARAVGALRATAGASARVAPAAALLTLELAEALGAGALDLGRLVGRWIACWPTDSVQADLATDAAVRHLATTGRPPGSGDGVDSLVALPLAIPAALATFRSPGVLLATAYHAARLVTSDERTAWGAVAIGVATARFLLSKGDFIPDVIEALAVNHAPPSLLGAIRRVPVLRFPVGGMPGFEQEHASTRAVVAALWVAHREPNAGRAAEWLAGAGISPHGVVAAAGLLGARDGEARIPGVWVPTGTVSQRCSDLAVRLAAPDALRGAGGAGPFQAAPENAS